ncbi:MAG: NUDIX domain-containing protein [Clostridia bacterium]|nr:NUDIX domain-containing protein [Clostridia bacterium]
MEKRDLYDENKKLTGETIFKGETIPKGRYYITVVIFIQNEEGKFLIQKRVKEKDGKWATTGGHPVSGESSKQGIITEIKEELGIDVENENIQLFKTIKTEDDFVDLYYLKENVNIENIVVQQEEVEKAKWASIEEIKEMIQNNEFSKNHTKFFIMCLDFLNKK